MSTGIFRMSRMAAALIAFLAIGALATPATAQLTTGGLAGQVVSQSDRSPLPGVAIEAIHVPTGTRYSAVTNESGRFTIVNARVGGPTASRRTRGVPLARGGERLRGAGDVTNLSFEFTLDTVRGSSRWSVRPTT